MARRNGQTSVEQLAGPGEREGQGVGPGEGAGNLLTAPPSGGLSLDVNDDELPPESPPENPPDLVEARPARVGDDTRPYCPRHNCLCKAVGTKKHATTYACPVDGCDTREKRARPQTKIPAEPMACPNRSCAGQDRFLEANPELTTMANLHMECGGCGFHVKVPRPQFNPNLARQRAAAAVEDFAER